MLEISRIREIKQLVCIWWIVGVRHVGKGEMFWFFYLVAMDPKIDIYIVMNTCLQLAVLYISSLPKKPR
ncbi:hypothetical protein BGX38DRAFT_1218571 [Terfezia claveryi]|nr:hypothetical protein BGX38DRAFT_1218571 [Terfezia claveryi]